MNESTSDRQRAYRAGAQVARERVAREAPLDAAALDQIEASDIVIVPGTYDHVENVLEALEMPFTPVDPGQLSKVPLRPEQLLVINCPGQISRRAVDHVRDFVAAGGSLFATDWALRHVIEPAFPDTIAYNDQPTADTVVRIEILKADNPFLQGVMDGEDDPQWWLEASSYPIRVLDRDRVEVLITSRELGDSYGESPVAVLFPHGEGEVFHMISHYYLQRTELRNERHNAPAYAYAAEKGVAMDAALSANMRDLRVGDVESAQTSARLMANVVASKKRSANERASANKKTGAKKRP